MNPVTLNHESGLGRCVVKQCADFVLIDEIWVDPQARQQGIGTEMLLRLITAFGHLDIMLSPDSDVIPSYILESWYSKHGFVWNNMGTYMIREKDNYMVGTQIYK